VSVTSVFGQFTPAPVVISQETTIKNGVIFYVHKVEKNQTIFSIAKAYNVSLNALVDNNPEIKSGLKEGATIYIKKSDLMHKDDFTKKEEVAHVESIIHVVRWYESLWSIAKKYNMTEDELMKFNSFEDNKIKTRQSIKIPVTAGESLNEAGFSEAESSRLKIASDMKVETETKNYSETKKEEKFTNSSQRVKVSHKPSMSHINHISLVLPIGSNNIESNDGNNNYLDFYQGFLLAVEDLKTEGMSINLNVLDLTHYSNGTLLAQSGKLEGSDIIIGPIFMNDVEPVAEYASEKGIPLISPMDPKTESLIETHNGFYQVSTNQYVQQEDLIKNISPYNKITLIYESSNPDSELVYMTQEILKNSRFYFSSFSYDVLSGRSITPQIADKLSKDSMNEVIVVSNSEAFVSDVLRNLNLLSSRSNYKITIYGTPRWRNFDNVDINYYHSMNLHLSVQYYIDYSNENVKHFLARYRALYRTEPTPYSYQAYDVAYYFLSALYYLGRNFSDGISEYSRELLQTDMKFVRNDNDRGYINSTTRQIIYNPDYSINISRLSR